MKKALIICAAVILLIATAIGFRSWQGSGSATAMAFLTAEVTRGDVLSVIRATGTVEPEDLIDVGAQVAGQILGFGTDVNSNTVDYCSIVREGMLLAKLDDVTYLADLRVAQAQLESSKANVLRAEADILQLEARLRQAERDWNRAQSLGMGEALSVATYDGYQSAYDVAKANIAVGQAELKQAQASVVQAEAAVEKAERNLGYCTILAPVDGVVIDRRVNVGQTVVASLNAPSLFLIAKDLRRVEVWVAVNEADIGEIHEGMRVLFTVDAFPGRQFEGRVSRIRLNASMTQNVVTYTVEVKTGNEDGQLLPYLTANLQFVTGEARGALRVPAAALRWQPDGTRGALSRDGGTGVVHVLGPDNMLRRVEVTTGVSDGTHTEVRADGLREGDRVITGQTVATKQTAAPAAEGESSNGKNPFMPSMPRPPRGHRPPG